MNSLNFVGRLSRDCESRFTPSGDAITSFSVSLDSGYGDKKITSWMNCAMFGKRGEAVAQYLKKGTQVAISGEFCARSYKDKNENERISLDVRVNDLTLLGGKQTDKQDSSEHHPGARDQKNPTYGDSSPASNSPRSFDNFDSYIPF